MFNTAARQPRRRTVQDGDDLEQTTGRPFILIAVSGKFGCEKGNELVELKTPGGEHWLRIGQAIGDVDAEPSSGDDPPHDQRTSG